MIFVYFRDAAPKVSVSRVWGRRERWKKMETGRRGAIIIISKNVERVERNCVHAHELCE